MNEEELWALESLGHFYFVRDDVARARNLFEAAVTIAPERGYSWYAMGLLALGERDYDAAISHLQKARRRSEDPRFALAHAEALIQAQRAAEAQPILRQLAHTDSTIGRRAQALLARLGATDAELPG